MSRSRRKSPVISITGSPSEKTEKRLANRRLRHRVKEEIERRDPDELVVPIMDEVYDHWNDGSKDGKYRESNDFEGQAARYASHPLFEGTKYVDPEYWRAQFEKRMRK